LTGEADPDDLRGDPREVLGHKFPCAIVINENYTESIGLDIWSGFVVPSDVSKASSFVAHSLPSP
jgi:hypothetical protein